jgi:ureidoacrylate peracid hydrolase
MQQNEIVPSPHASGASVILQARPEALELPVSRTALIVVDMQNGYASAGGYRDLMGRNIKPAAKVIEQNSRIIEASRKAGLTIVFLKNGWDPELKTAGDTRSPNWYKSNPLKLMRSRSDLAGKLLIHGSWDYEFVSELTPQPSDFVVPKTRYSGFCNTDLDNILRARDIRHLIFTGIATNVCVESTLREAYHREYFCVLVEDAVQQSGPDFVQKASLYSIETFLGWVTDSDTICHALARVLNNATA